ncbi:metal ion ABC transporter ATPase [Paenibacillus sabinae T27]|uniref:Metal ion ABC transporter ATPase n=1 Tax=Paenibacillus sabinae T27 TaxID=1268072 RepID=X4ZYU5_9BACL|nr:ATP-binding cassette domain-containing protein [Paenibacillus sabinae]AHV96829.1 metal ion ABC transporter ATPase [Paenibacillus sabinae T27]
MVIVLDKVNVIFKQKGRKMHAVKEASISINKGEIFGIVGPSGAGKSTLVRVINLLQPPASGRVIVGGQDITRFKGTALRKVRLKIGMIFQHFNLISGATVYDNIAFALKANNCPEPKIRERVLELLTQVNLADKEQVYPANLSGGQKQRVAIARALANDPEILLCDEATSALDLENTEEIIRILRRINRENPITIVFITHEMDVARKLFDRIAVMADGEIVEVGDTYRVFTEPEHPMTQSLVSRVLNIEIPEHLQLKDQEEMLKITYTGERAYEPLISKVSKEFDVLVDILHGKIEYIQGKPLGILLIKLSGDAAEIAKARDYIAGQVFKIERLSAAIEGGELNG